MTDRAAIPSGPLLIRELPWQDPADLLVAIGDRPGLAFLDSAAVGDARARATYIAVDPVDEVRLTMASMDDVRTTLRRLHTRREPAAAPLPFTGGLVGMIGYDAAARSMTGPGRHPGEEMMPDCVVRRYDLIIGFDMVDRRCWGFASDRHGISAAARLDDLLQSGATPISPNEAVDWIEQSPEARHGAMVDKVLDYLAAGDIYQANVTTRFTADRPRDFSPIAAYLALRARSPAPFGVLLDLGHGSTLLGASPERFVRLTRSGDIETRPIKGTIARDADPARDQANAATLAASSKDIAENLMICDLLRNDLSQVAVAGSVEVPELAAIEGFASVWHLVSSVRARLAAGHDAIDLLHATLPGGSITGAPKKRAIEVIDEVEDAARGAFYGIVFWIGDDGAMDSSIIIRSVVATPTRLVAAAGGGIVADSEALTEYAELRAKIDPILEAFGQKP